MTTLLEQEETEELQDQEEFEASEQKLSFEERFATWDPELAIRVKDPKAKAYVLDQIFWNTPRHHKSPEFYQRVLGFIRHAIARYGIEEQQGDRDHDAHEDLIAQCYNKICEAIDNYFDPYKANVVTFLHKVLFNHIKLCAYHVEKYKDGTFYTRFFTYDSIIKSITRNVTTQDLIVLDNYLDHMKNVFVSNPTRQFLKGDLIRIAPRNNVLFKAVIWELLQSNEEMKIGKFNNKFTNRSDIEAIHERRTKIRRS